MADDWERDPGIAETIASRAAELLGSRATSSVPAPGGYTAATRLVLILEDGRSVFAKAGTEPMSAEWVLSEIGFYRQVEGSFLPRVLAMDEEGPAPILVLEDLSEGVWPPPWSEERVGRVKSILEEVSATPPPPDLPPLAELRTHLFGWVRLAVEPEPFLALGACSRAWLETALPTLVEAEAAAPLEGDRLVHLDVRSDNICFAGDRTLLVDWNMACVGNPAMDLASWAPSLQLEGGPAPEETAGHEPELAALISGYFAHRSGQPVGDASPRIRAVQHAQLGTALPWAARALGLPPPDPTEAGRR